MKKEEYLIEIENWLPLMVGLIVSIWVPIVGVIVAITSLKFVRIER